MKNNLAKVLGLEEYNQEPNIRVEPTEDEVIQIQQDNFEQEMSDHQEATTEALEAIGNAQALASVIARNDSQDKTAYELLKVAVEQLKEKTGVKTQSVSLESLDKGSYKTEALEDVKKFISKIWEAIKKAFFAMVDKVKAFVKMLFSSNKKTEDKLDEASKANEEFVKEAKNVPDSPNSNKEYKGDYFKAEKTAPATQAPKAAKQYHQFKPSRAVADMIGTREASAFTASNVSSRIKSLYSKLEDLVDSIISLKLEVIAQEYERQNKDYSQGGIAPPSYVSYLKDAKIDRFIDVDLGPDLQVIILATENAQVKVGSDFVGNRHVLAIDPEELSGDVFPYLSKITKLTDKLTENSNRYEKSMSAFFKSQEQIYNSIQGDQEQSQGRIETIKSGNEWFKKLVSNLIRITAEIVRYMNSFVSAFSDYSKQNIQHFKISIEQDLNNQYYVSPRDYQEYVKYHG